MLFKRFYSFYQNLVEKFSPAALSHLFFIRKFIILSVFGSKNAKTWPTAFHMHMVVLIHKNCVHFRN